MKDINEHFIFIVYVLEHFQLSSDGYAPRTLGLLGLAYTFRYVDMVSIKLL